MTQRLKFRQPSKKMGHECEYFAQNPVLIKISSFSLKVLFSSQNFPVHPACSFDDPRENCLPLFRNLLARSPRAIEIFLFPSKPFSSEKYTGQVDCRFENPAGKISTKTFIFLLSKLQNNYEKHFKEKKLFSSKCSFGHLECRFHKSMGNFTHKIGVDLAQNPKLRGNFAIQLNFGAKLFFRTFRKQN